MRDRRSLAGRSVVGFCLALLSLAAACGEDEPLAGRSSDGGAGGSGPDGSAATGGGSDSGGAGTGGALGSAGSGGEGDSGPRCDPQALPSAVELAAGSWSRDFSIAGVNGEAPGLRAIAMTADGDLVVGGLFSFGGLRPARNIAVWSAQDGWRSLGSGVDGNVVALSIAPDGRIFAASARSNSDFTEFWHQIDVYDGSAWRELARVELPPGVTEPELSGVARMQFAADGRLYVAGSFTAIGGVAAANLAVFDGTTFSAFGAPNGRVRALLVEGADVCAGGEFTRIGTIAAARVACWRAGTWQAHDLPDPEGVVFALGRQEGALVAAGSFELTDPSTYDGGSFARWSGSAWELIGRGVGIWSVFEERNRPGLVRDFVVHEGMVLLGGTFTNAAGAQADGAPNVAVSHIAEWRPGWNAVDGGARRQVGFARDFEDAFAAVAHAGSVYVVGIFTATGAAPAFHVSRWDGARWHSLGNAGEKSLGVHGRVNAVAPDGACGLYAGGQFDFVGGVAASNVARLAPDGSWQAIGAGVNGAVDALVVDARDGAPIVSSFECSGEVCSSHVRRWDGAQFAPVGAPFEGPIGELAVAPDGKLYAAGDVVTPAGTGYVFRLQGDEWQVVGGGTDGVVTALMVDPNGSLIAGGAFQSAGGVAASNVARFDGTNWHALGAGLAGQVLALTAYDGRIAASGQRGFGDQTTQLVAIWDGSTWNEIGDALHDPDTNPAVNALAAAGRTLFVTGQFPFFGGVAVYDGERWTRLGSMNEFGSAVAIAPNGLFVGGGFGLMDDRPGIGLGWLAP